MTENTIREIENLIKENRVNEAIRLCRENRISAKDFGRILERGITTEIGWQKDKALIATRLYGRLIKVEKADTIVKRVERREAYEAWLAREAKRKRIARKKAKAKEERESKSRSLKSRSSARQLDRKEGVKEDIYERRRVLNSG